MRFVNACLLQRLGNLDTVVLTWVWPCLITILVSSKTKQRPRVYHRAQQAQSSCCRGSHKLRFYCCPPRPILRMGIQLDKWIEKVRRCEYLAEDELKALCEYVRLASR